jgi:hypothetical protein
MINILSDNFRLLQVENNLYGPVSNASKPMWIDDWVAYFTTVKVQSISHRRFVSVNNQ